MACCRGLCCSVTHVFVPCSHIAVTGWSLLGIAGPRKPASWEPAACYELQPAFGVWQFGLDHQAWLFVRCDVDDDDDLLTRTISGRDDVRTRLTLGPTLMHPEYCVAAISRQGLCQSRTVHCRKFSGRRLHAGNGLGGGDEGGVVWWGGGVGRRRGSWLHVWHHLCVRGSAPPCEKVVGMYHY